MISLKKLLYHISLLSLISPVSLSCMEIIKIELPSKKIERRNKDIKKRSTEIINNFYQNKDIANPRADICVLYDRRTLMQKKINNKYKALSISIQQTYNIDFDFYTYFQNIEKHLTITNEQKDNIHSEIPIQPESRFHRSYLHSYLKKTLRKNNIAKSLVTFTSNNNECYAESPTFTSRIKDNLLHIDMDKPGCINIRQNILTDLSIDTQRGYCFALMNQFKHKTIAMLLYLIVDAMTEEVIDEKEFYMLMSPDKSLSLLNFALKYPRSAYLLQKFYQEIYSSFSINDYNKLCKIATLDSALAWLKEYEQNNQKPTIKNTPVSQHKICKLCLGKMNIVDTYSNYPDWCDNCCSAHFGMLRLAI